jgi:hypothetical protein
MKPIIKPYTGKLMLLAVLIIIFSACKKEVNKPQSQVELSMKNMLLTFSCYQIFPVYQDSHLYAIDPGSAII